MSFDFRTNATPTINLDVDENGPKCENGPGCTHFTWTLFNGGTCWMKKGRMNRNGTETITIKAEDPNLLCAKLAKIAKIYGADLNWYDFAGNDDFPALADRLNPPTKCPLTPPKSTTCHASNHSNHSSNSGCNTTTTSCSTTSSSCTTASSNTINFKKAAPSSVFGNCKNNRAASSCLQYTWRLINEAATLKRRLIMNQKQEETTGPVLVEIESKQAPKQAAELTIEEHLPPIISEPGDKPSDFDDHFRDPLKEDESKMEEARAAVAAAVNKKASANNLAQNSSPNVAPVTAAPAPKNGNTIWLGIQTSTTPPDSIEPPPVSSNRQVAPAPRIEICNGSNNNQRWATVDLTKSRVVERPKMPAAVTPACGSCCCGNCTKSLVRVPERTIVASRRAPHPVASYSSTNSNCLSSSSISSNCGVANNCDSSSYACIQPKLPPMPTPMSHLVPAGSCSCGSCDFPLPPPPLPLPLPSQSQSSSSTPLIVAALPSFSHHRPDFSEGSGALVDNYSILLSRKADAGMSGQLQQAQNACQCGGGCLNLGVSDVNDLSQIYGMPAVSFGYDSTGGMSVDQNDDVCFCGNCSGGGGGGGGNAGVPTENAIQELVAYVQAAANGDPLAISVLTSMGFDPCLFQPPQQETQPTQTYQSAMAPFDFIPVALGNGFGIDDHDQGSCNFCGDNNPYEYVIC